MSLNGTSERACVRTVRAAVMCGVVAMASGAWAQDTRTVTEPKIPATCVKLRRRFTLGRTALPEADETNGDTARIQEAIDGLRKCKPGLAVELAQA